MKKFLDSILAIFPYIIVFVGSLYGPADPDLGWHLKNGEYFFKFHKILRDNPYTTMMPNFHWANVSWGTDLITYFVYHYSGFLGLTILAAIIVSFTFYFLSKAARLTLWDQVFLFPLLMYLETPINSVSFRGQQITLLFLGILFYIFSLSKQYPKIMYLTVPLFLIWANLHGEFILGIVIFFCWIVISFGQKIFIDIDYKNLYPSLIDNFLKNKTEIFLIFLIFMISIVATIINPFGIAIHKDALSHVGSPLLKDISEYLPFTQLSQAWWNQVIVAIFLLLGLIFLYFKEELSVQLPTLTSVLLLYIFSFSVRRFAWPAYYLIFPILKPLPNFLKPERKRTTKISSAILLFIIFLIVASNKFPFIKLLKFDWNNYCEVQYSPCTPVSAMYLEKNKLTKDLYSLYGWGGWLIWNYPAIKPTIDGRMHMWKDDNGYSGFVDYFSYEQNVKDIDKSKYNVVYISPDKPVYNRLIDLVRLGKWRLDYHDKYSGIFVRNIQKI